MLKGSAEHGAFLPAERELAEQYRASRKTIRRAIKCLAEKGLVEIQSNCRPRVSSSFSKTESALPEMAATSGIGLRHIGLFSAIPFANRIDTGSDEFSNLIAATFQFCQEAGYTVAYTNTYRHGGLDPMEFRSMLPDFYAGAIVSPSPSEAAAICSSLERWGKPSVLLNARVEPVATHVHTVDLDDAAGMLLALGHLWERGYRRIAHVTFDEDLAWIRTRLGAYEEWMAERGQPARVRRFPRRHCAGDEGDSLSAGLPELDGAEWDAVVTGNDLIAARLFDLAKAKGLRVPEDLALVGFDNVAMAIERDLTTVSAMPVKIGRRAAEIMLADLKGGAPGTTYRERIAPRLVVRRSVGKGTGA